MVEAEKAGPAALNKVLINKVELRKNLTSQLNSNFNQDGNIYGNSTNDLEKNMTINNLQKLKRYTQDFGLTVHDLHYLKSRINIFVFIRFFF